jgi:adenosylcobinamide-phosphate synthase
MIPTVALGLTAGYLLDAVLGDPRRLHPVAGFGRLATIVERHTWADDRATGAAVTGGLVTATVLGVLALQRAPGQRRGARTALHAVVTWLAVGHTSLLREGAEMQRRLAAGDLDGARDRLSHLCGRDAATLDDVGLARATVESVAENTSDAVVAPLLWALVGGAPAVAGYRALNTLDAMIGSRTSRYRRYGWAAARLDDLANWVPARLTALLAAALAPLVGGRWADARAAWQRDAGGHPSPNAGPVEAAFAGALAVRLGGTVNTYGDHRDVRPPLGDGCQVVVADIARAATLSRAVGLAALALCAAAATVGGRR